MRASEIRKGTAVIMEGKLFVVTDANHNTPGNLRAKVQFKLRDVTKGTIMDKRVGATEDIETTVLDSRNVEYLYSDNEGHWLMDLENYEQNPISKEVFGDDIKYLKPNTQLTALFHDGKLISYELPKNVDLKVTDTAPGIKGATATNQMKDAELETGLKTRVPPFIEVGETIRISTETGGYLSRS
ncbi:MAG TPA: elongation factor P [Tepidisphaeraceae bacterium]|jgi:elongation factor P|nr:elongation factor P [Tepidisphaeraceae bacterium]